MATQQTIPQSLEQSKLSALPIIRAANNHTLGVRTFYVASQSNAGAQYVVQFIRRAGQRRWFCDCGDFKFRKPARKRHCKHIHQLTALVREAHGVSHLVISA